MSKVDPWEVKGRAPDLSGVRIQEQAPDSRGSYITGSIGALLGALLGSAVLVMFSRVGYVASLSGFAIAYFSAKGYKLLGGPIRKGMPVIISIMVILGTFFGVLASYAAEGVIDYGFSVGSAISILWSALPYFDFLGELLSDAIIPLLFAAIGAWAIIQRLYKEATGTAEAASKAQNPGENLK